MRRHGLHGTAGARHGSGFSLLELLVAVTVLGFLATMIAGGVRFGLDAWRTGARMADGLESARHVTGLMQRQIAGLSARRMRGPGRETIVAFDGRPDRLRFLGSMPGIVEAAGPQIIGYGLAPDGAGDRLVLHWRDLDADEGPFADRNMEEEMLLSGVKTLRFSYFGRADPGRAARWHDTWNRQGRLPDLIRVTIEPRDGADWHIAPFILAVETDRLGA